MFSKIKKLPSKIMLIMLSLFLMLPGSILNLKAEGSSISTDKDVYKVGEPIMVTAETDYPGAWVALLKASDPIDAKSFWWYYPTGEAAGQPVNLFSYDSNNRDGITSADMLPPGEYRVAVVCPATAYFAGAEKYITIEANVVSSLSLNKEKEEGDWGVKYAYGDPIIVTATSANPNASVRVCDRDENGEHHQHLEAWYLDYKLSEYPDPVDIIALAEEEGVEIPGGQDYRIYLIEPTEDNPNNTDVSLQAKVTILEEPATNQYLSTDKAEYAYGEPVMVTVKDYPLKNGSSYWTWVGLYRDGDAYASGTSTSWYYLISYNAVNIIDLESLRASEGEFNYPDRVEAGGKFKVVLFGDDGGFDDVIEEVEITIASRPESSLTLDKEKAEGDWGVKYAYGEPIIVTATSANPNASVRVCDRDENGEHHQHLEAWYLDYKLSEHPGSVDIIALAEEEGVEIPGGQDYRIYLIEPVEGNPNNTDLSLQGKITILEEPVAESYLSTDKDEYEFEESIMVTVTGYDKYDYYWVGLYAAGDTPTSTNPSYSWDDGYTSGVAKDLMATHYQKPLPTEGGEFDVVLMYTANGSDYNVEERKTITIKPSTVVPPVTEYLSTDKEEYFMDEPIMVTLSNAYQYDGYIWIGLFDKDAVPGEDISYWYLDTDHVNLYQPNNILAEPSVLQNTVPGPGEYDLILMYQGNGTWYNVVERKTITLKSNVENSIAVDKQDDGKEYHEYKYNEPVLVTATSPNANASVRLCDANPGDTYGYDNGYYVSYNLSDYDNPVDIMALAKENGVMPEPNKKLRLYLISPTPENTNNWVMQTKCLLLETYYDDDEKVVWTLSEDKTTATITFKRMDDETITETFEAVVGEKTVEEPTCTEPGKEIYPVSFEFTEENQLVTNNDKTEFEGTVEFEIAALGHDWGKWHQDSEDPTKDVRECSRCDATETREHVECQHEHMAHVEAKEATCTEDGCIEHYYCEDCERYFADENATTELDEEEVILPALGHDYGDYIYDEENHKHWKECSRCHDKIEEGDCQYEWEIVDGVAVFTCSVCGHGYEEVLFSTDKKEYKQWEPIMVTVNIELAEELFGAEFNDEAWVGLYRSPQEPAGDMSIRWYYVYEETNPYNILSKAEGHGIENLGVQGDYREGDFDLWLLKDGGYNNRVGKITVHVTDEVVPAGDITLELNGVEQTENLETEIEFGQPIKTKANVDGVAGRAWVGMYLGRLTRESVFGEDNGGPASKAWYYISAYNGAEFDFATAQTNGVKAINEAGEYTLVVFGTESYDDIRLISYVTLYRVVDHEEVIKEPTCTESGTKMVYYKDGYEAIEVIDALGHDWGEWTFDEETHTHSHECARCEEIETEDCTFESVTEDGVTTYTCTVCGGQYEHINTVADNDIFRTAGDNRYLTALKAADVFMEKTGLEKLHTVVLACGSNFADALAGSYLAAVKNAPIVLIDDNDKASKVLEYLKNNVAEGGKIYILGGDKAVAPKFEKTLGDYGFDVTRLKGDNRYATNLEILKEAGVDGEKLLVSTGTNFADSLSASAAGLPILLVGTSLTADQKAFLEENSGKRIYILGGDKVVSNKIMGDLGAYGVTKRVAGGNRHETSIKIAQEFFSGVDTVLFAVSDKFPDGLCGGALAYQLNAPVILIKDGNTKFAKEFVKEMNITKGVVLGGKAALKDALINDIFGLDKNNPIEVY